MPSRPSPRSTRPCRWLVPLLVLFSASSARATWSIVAVDRSTGEVCIAGATCLTGTALRRLLAVMVVGRGGAVAQANGDSGGENRLRMWNSLHAGATAYEALIDVVENGTTPATRQYGIVTLDSAPAAWSGTGVGFSKCEVYSQVGDVIYTIQGNVLTGPLVCYEAERALLTTSGDLGQRVMAAMQAARAMGGDGRCSCQESDPEGCGAPPEDFEKSAHVAFMVMSRLGDLDGECSQMRGCANGDYYMNLNIFGAVADPDPILRLQRQYDRWRAYLRGVPDHLLTSVEPADTQLVADGSSQTSVTLRLNDLEGDPLGHGGQLVSLTYTGTQPPAAVAGAPVDMGDGTHVFPVTATTDPGTASWRILIEQGPHDVQLHPELVIEVVP